MDLSYFKQPRGWAAEFRTLPQALRSTLDLFLASAGINLLALALPIVLMQVYDRIVPTQATSTLLWLVVGFGCALILETILRLCRSTITNLMAARFEYDISHECVSRWLDSDLEKFERDGAGVHLDRLRAVNTLRSYYAGQGLQLLMDLSFAFIFLAAIAFLSGVKIVLYLSVVTALFMIIVSAVKRRYEGSRRKQKVLGDRRYNFLVEALGGIHVIKALTLEESMLRRHERLAAETATSDYNVIFVGNMPICIGSMFSQLVLFGVLLVGGTQVIEGQITLGSLAACTLLSGRFFQPVKSLASFWARYADVEIAKQQIREIALLEQSTDSTALPLPDEVEGSIDLQNISFRYAPSSPLLFDAASLKIQPREFVCLHSRTSRGASTLLNIMYGILAPQAGTVSIDGQDINSLCHGDWRARVEFLPQQGTLFGGTIFDNLTLFEPALRDTAIDAAALLGLDDALSDLPQGYETEVGNRPYTFLPSGVIQRICLARALTVRPRVMLLDNITDSMDSDSEQYYLWLMNKLKGCCTMVVATSNPQLLGIADTVYSIENAQLVQVEPTVCR